MRKQNRNFLIVMFSIALIGIIVVALAGYYNSSTWIKTYRFQEQYIGSIDIERTPELAPCNNCLIMKVQDEWWTPSGLMTNNLTIFFGDEHKLRNDLQSGDLINVRWRHGGNKAVIRGVWKAGGEKK